MPERRRPETRRSAAAALGQAGFKPKTTPETVTEPTQVGIVLAQSPAAGANARKGATVTLTVGVLGAATTPTTHDHHHDHADDPPRR